MYLIINNLALLKFSGLFKSNFLIVYSNPIYLINNIKNKVILILKIK
jgi:hypothetical protein